MGIFEQFLGSFSAVDTNIGPLAFTGNLVNTGNGIRGAIGVALAGRQGAASPFGIDRFRTNLSAHKELAKTDKFDVNIMIPQSLWTGGTTMSDLTLQCEAAELPGRDINLIEYRHYGFIRRIPHQNQYGQAAFTFYVTGDLHEKKLFDRWMDLMIPTNSGLVTYPEDDSGNHIYDCNIFINQYDMTGQLQYKVQLLEAMPTSVSPLATTWGADDVHRLTVAFAFKKWQTIETQNNARGSPGDPNNGINNFVNKIIGGAEQGLAISRGASFPPIGPFIKSLI